MIYKYFQEEVFYKIEGRLNIIQTNLYVKVWIILEKYSDNYHKIILQLSLVLVCHLSLGEKFSKEIKTTAKLNQQKYKIKCCKISCYKTQKSFVSLRNIPLGEY